MKASDRAGRKVLEAQKREARQEREYKKAVIKLSRSVPTLIDELRLLRGAISRMR